MIDTSKCGWSDCKDKSVFMGVVTTEHNTDVTGYCLNHMRMQCTIVSRNLGVKEFISFNIQQIRSVEGQLSDKDFTMRGLESDQDD